MECGQFCVCGGENASRQHTVFMTAKWRALPFQTFVHSNNNPCSRYWGEGESLSLLPVVRSASRRCPIQGKGQGMSSQSHHSLLRPKSLLWIEGRRKTIQCRVCCGVSVYKYGIHCEGSNESQTLTNRSSSSSIPHLKRQQ